MIMLIMGRKKRKREQLREETEGPPPIVGVKPTKPWPPPPPRKQPIQRVANTLGQREWGILIKWLEEKAEGNPAHREVLDYIDGLSPDGSLVR